MAHNAFKLMQKGDRGYLHAKTEYAIENTH